ncbi:MAG TPA: glycoside hydrolase family 32 protein [Candidatus Scybalocola faecavium]|nr:glycoside hydrolase family 32 protein [Candidatus Scybalocola faecavium]
MAVRQNIHLKCPGGWINDPNGFIYYKGKYHLFYQYFPYAPQWGRMHWGHAVSDDLAHWEHVGVALYPSKYNDADGCFSGSAVEHNGKLYLYYTGIRYDKQDPENTNLGLEQKLTASQMMIVSEDGIHFDNVKDKRTIIEPIKDKQIGDLRDTRDPKVWRGKDAWYMILGSTWELKAGRFLFYTSTDLEHWEFVNMVQGDDALGIMWECPDYYEVNGEQAIVFSPIDIACFNGKGENHAICMPVTFDEAKCEITLSKDYQFFDYGMDLYAPQSTTDAQGRRIEAAWLRMPESPDGEWIGMFCIPRVTEVIGGHFYFRVHPDVDKLFARKIMSPAEASSDGYKISADLPEEGWINIGGYRIFRKDRTICTDRSRVYRNHTECRCSFSTPDLKDGFHIDVYVDANMIEVYVNQGEYVITNGVYDLKQTVEAGPGVDMVMYTLEQNL